MEERRKLAKGRGRRWLDGRDNINSAVKLTKVGGGVASNEGGGLWRGVEGKTNKFRLGAT